MQAGEAQTSVPQSNWTFYIGWARTLSILGMIVQEAYRKVGAVALLEADGQALAHRHLHLQRRLNCRGSYFQLTVASHIWHHGARQARETSAGL